MRDFLRDHIAVVIVTDKPANPSEPKFDPIDIAMLGAGWETGSQSEALSVERAQALVDVAELLHRLWLELDEDSWTGVWAYEVAEPLGVRIGEHFAAHGAMPEPVDVERWARELIAEAVWWTHCRSCRT